MNKCPGCGEGFPDKPTKRNGWVYAECGRRWHPKHGWESFEPVGCLRRQRDVLIQKVEKLRAAQKNGDSK